MKPLLRSATIISICALSTTAGASPIELRKADLYTLVGAGVNAGTSSHGGNLVLGSEAQVFGSAGARNYIGVSAGVRIHEHLHGGYINASPDLVVHGNKTSASPYGSGLLNNHWPDVYQDMLDASATAAALEGEVINSVLDSKTLTAQDKPVSVYHINGRINLGAGQFLKISGTEADKFVINVTQGLDLGSGASIVVEGVQPGNVLFNFTGGGPGGPSATAAAGQLSGIFLAPRMFWQLGDGLNLPATRVLASGIEANIQDITPPPVVFVPDPPESEPVIPEPIALSLVSTAAGILLLGRHPRTMPLGS
jgi:hypothetical protein